MPYENTRQLKEDVLFRASEPPGGVSGWETKIIDYLNRVYRTLATGASEFLPEFIDDWWWMREESYFILEPVYSTGTVTATNGSNVVTFSDPPTFDPAGWMLRFKDVQVPDIFRIAFATYGPSQPNQELDAPYTGKTVIGAAFQLMKTHYNPPSNVKPQVLIGPMRAFRDEDQILGMAEDRMDELWPLARLAPGTPKAFAIVQELNELQNPGEKFEVRFSHGGLLDHQQRIDFWYRPVLDDLLDAITSIPRVPAQWRHVLADMALVQVLLDKNDDRANAAALGARTALAAMLKENRRRNVKIDYNAGHIYPRGGVGHNRNRDPIRTESGLIIG
jgi:hypothetical protein